MKSAAIKFEKKSDTVVVAFIKKQRHDYMGRPFTATEATRAIREGEGWRVDFCGNVGGAWLPWEPIVSTVFPNLTAAKKEIRRYAAEVSE